MQFIDQHKLFAETDGGRLVIEKWHPASADSFANPARPFKLRPEEKTASARVKKMPDGNWIVTDFGSDSQPRNAIQIVMQEEGLEFIAAINLIAAEFGIVPDEQRAQIIKPTIRKQAASAEQAEGQWYFDIKDFSQKEIQTILPAKVWQWLINQLHRHPSETQAALAKKEVEKVFKRYHFYSLASYTIIKNREAITISSNEHFPMFMFDCTDWKKIYKPREILAANRFLYHGGRPSDFVFGYDYLAKQHAALISISDDEEPEEQDSKSKKKEPKLKHAFFCSGGSDGLTLAVIGQAFKPDDKTEDNYYPLWLNSETARLDSKRFADVKAKCESVYNLPDIDATGISQAHKIATAHLEIKTIYLPAEMAQVNDNFRKKPKKDLRDYFATYPVYSFYNLMRTAYPYRFWDVQAKYNKRGEFVSYGFNVNNKHLYNFLARNGFYRFETEAEKDGYIYIQIDGNIVRKIEPKRIRDFINLFIEQRNPDVELMNTFLRTNQLNEGSLSNLPFIKIDFTDFDKESQWFFFNNGACCATATQIQHYKPGAVRKYVWEHEVINRKVEVLPDFFTVALSSQVETRQPAFDIDIHNSDCLVFKYLINVSRIYWREELETRIDGIKDEKDREQYAALHRFTETDLPLLTGLPTDQAAQYVANNRFTITGSLLTEREKAEQKLHLINKLYGIGHIFHRHKENAKSWALWGMDAKLSEGDESHGGTGKSLLPNLINNYKLMNTQYREGRNPKLIDNPHFWEGTDKHTDLMLVDDCSRYLKFDFFFSSISGPVTVNPKNNKQYTISFTDSPKIWFTSNYPPYGADISTERRILYLIYSDYYHYSRMGEYREDRTVMEDLGKSLGADFDPNEWNLFLNLIMQCVKFYLSCQTKISPPMENVNRRNLKNIMGEAFEAWADVFFSPESGRLDEEQVKEDCHHDYLKSVNPKVRTINNFSSLIRAWCNFHNYELNPRDMCNSRTNGRPRIIRKVKIKELGGTDEKTVTKEMLYIRSKAPGEIAMETANKQLAEKISETDEIPF